MMRQWMLSIVIEASSGERALYQTPVYATSEDEMAFSAQRHVAMMQGYAVEVESHSFKEIIPHDPELQPRLSPLENVRGSMVMRAGERPYLDIEDFVERGYTGVEETKGSGSGDRVETGSGYKGGHGGGDRVGDGFGFGDPPPDHHHLHLSNLYLEDTVLKEIEESDPMLDRPQTKARPFWSWLWDKVTRCSCSHSDRTPDRRPSSHTYAPVQTFLNEDDEVDL